MIFLLSRSRLLTIIRLQENTKEIEMPPGVLVVLLFRGQETMMPNGDTSLEGGDLLICAAPAFEDRENLTLYEVEIDKNHKWRDKPVNELDQKAGVLIVMVKREGSTLIPNGNTIIRQDDLLVFVGKNTQNRRMGKFHVLFCFWMCEFQTAGKELQLGKEVWFGSYFRSPAMGQPR